MLGISPHWGKHTSITKRNMIAWTHSWTQLPGHNLVLVSFNICLWFFSFNILSIWSWIYDVRWSKQFLQTLFMATLTYLSAALAANHSFWNYVYNLLLTVFLVFPHSCCWFSGSFPAPFAYLFLRLISIICSSHAVHALWVISPLDPYDNDTLSPFFKIFGRNSCPDL